MERAEPPLLPRAADRQRRARLRCVVSEHGQQLRRGCPRRRRPTTWSSPATWRRSLRGRAPRTGGASHRSLFMRALLCLQPVCGDPAHFDIWAHHPYTSGGPNHQATRPNDVSLGDLPEMRKVLVDGIKVGHVLSATEVRFWVTEFSYESNPPDPGGLKPGLGARWTSEALYRMWRAGVTQVDVVPPHRPAVQLVLRPVRPLPPWKPVASGRPAQADSSVLPLPLRGVPDRQPEGRQQSLGGVPEERDPRARLGTRSRRDSASASSSSSGAERPGVPSPRSRRTGTGSSAARSTPRRRALYAPARSTRSTVSRAFSLARPKDRFISPFGANWSRLAHRRTPR